MCSIKLNFVRSIRYLEALITLITFFILILDLEFFFNKVESVSE